MLLAVPLEKPLRADAAGVVRVGETRVALEVVVAAFRAGATPEEIVARFPTLSLTDAYATITFYLRHSGAVDEYIAAHEVRAEANRGRAEAIEPMAAVRARLLARSRIAS